ncbi:acetylxylan esterase [Pelagicoccus mobilis]|uniref:Acetylxylan esterase n=1 Tax=Pelagicoccus mobilis TaxID=415221 RepID=A0A934S4C7_9BACT|nr:acetylxylan esterase [Pelagicoccus mobilis]MBK1880516.1 acetylxylan esterase [Pelagicoccus mobilis]
MKALRYSSLILVFLNTFLLSAIELSLNHESGLYEKGETIRVSAKVADSADSSPFQLKVLKNHDTVYLEKEIAIEDETEVIFEEAFDETCSIIVELSRGDHKDVIGTIVAPKDIVPGSKRPRDFDTFWKKRKKLVKSMPFETEKTAIELNDSDTGYEAFDIEINSPGPRPARGILAKPIDAEKGSLPIVITLRAAGVKGIWCRSDLKNSLEQAKRGGGALSFDMNAHGMLNHQEEAYYEELENGPLKEYFNHGVEDKNEYYFGYMYLRMLRAIEYLTQQPEWDGERILVVGESQGGGQSLAAAGLDPRVTAAVVTVPAMCDWGAPLIGHKGGWPLPLETHGKDNKKVLKTTPYFDAAHLLKGSKATIVCEVGLTDQICSSTSIYAALNQVDGEVIVYPVSYRNHFWPEGADRKHWDATTFAAKQAFIDDYLK